MKLAKTNNLPLDQFINFALYDKDKGFYMKKNPFGEDGDFITAPNITRLFSEIIAIWTITFWKSIGSPKKFNLLELGAGNGEMMKVIDETLINFPECYNACSFVIHEKSDFLINEQKKNLNSEKIHRIISENFSYETISKNYINLIEDFIEKNKFTYTFNSSEINKNQKNVDKILNFLLNKNFSREDSLLAIGGGITGDVSGFAASIYKRGLKFINVPTTLLAQVDSSIGGKTGVNNIKFYKKFNESRR